MRRIHFWVFYSNCLAAAWCFANIPALSLHVWHDARYSKLVVIPNLLFETKVMATRKETVFSRPVLVATFPSGTKITCLAGEMEMRQRGALKNFAEHVRLCTIQLHVSNVFFLPCFFSFLLPSSLSSKFFLQVFQKTKTDARGEYRRYAIAMA